MSASAVTTARAVLQWSIEPSGPPPRGDLANIEGLLAPDQGTLETLSDAAMAARAKLGFRASAQGESLDLMALWVAAAVGGGPGPLASELLRLCRPSRSLPTAAVCNAVVEPALAHLAADFSEQLILVSPLSVLLILPAQGSDGEGHRLCHQLAMMREGRRILVHRFAVADPHPGRLSWRGRLMDGLYADPRHHPLLLDIYEAAVAHHGGRWLEILALALRSLLDSEPTSVKIQFALAVGRWWEPLRALHRSDHDSIRERRYLDFRVYYEGIRLASLTARLRLGQN